MTSLQNRLALLILTAAPVISGCSTDASYPSRPILLLCPWGVGGGTDRVSRQLAVFLEEELDVPVNVVNATGGMGVTGHSRGARARPDGYTILMMTVEINMLRWRELTDLSWEDYRPLMLVNRDAAALFVRDDAPWEDLDDLTRAVRENPGKLTASGTATGGIWHLALAGWLSSVGLEPTDINWISSKGAGPSLKELASEGIDMVCCSLPEARSMLDAGIVRCLGIMSRRPLPGYEHVPTFQSQGVDWVMGGWRGLALPAGTPDRVVDALLPALERIVTGKTVIEVPVIEDGEQATRRLTFPEFMAREKYDASWELPAEFRKTLARMDQELGRYLTSPEFSSITRYKVGPMAFPNLLFVLLGVVLASLAIRGWVRKASGEEREDGERKPVSAAGAAHFLEVILAVVFYILVADRLGFVITAGIILLVLLVRLGSRPWVSALVTALVSPAVYLLFAYVLKVPLPVGILGW